MAKQATPQHILCLDWETTGASWTDYSWINHQGIAFGAIVARADNFEPVEELYVEVKFDGTRFTWTEGAEKIHGISQAHLEEHGLSREDAATALLELIVKYWGVDGRVMFLGHNPNFDIGFTDQLLSAVGFQFALNYASTRRPADTLIEVHHVILDTSALGFITTGLFKSDLLFERMGYDKRGAHNALDDARMTLGTCATIRALVQAGEASLNG